MKIFVELKKLLNQLGISPNQKFNKVNLFILFNFAICLAAAIAFILFEPKTFVDLGNSFFECVSFLLNIFTLSSCVLKQKRIYLLFEKFEEMIEKRKSPNSTIFLCIAF